MQLETFIRTVPNYPKPGIQFRDITTLLKNSEAFNHSIDLLAQRYQDKGIDKIAGIESRGFIIGAALSYKMNIGFIPIRKKGKLPANTFSIKYELEYGTDELEIHQDAFEKEAKILLIDDLLATGGTALAGAKLINMAKGKIFEAAFLVDLPDLGGRSRLKEVGIESYLSLIHI